MMVKAVSSAARNSTAADASNVHARKARRLYSGAVDLQDFEFATSRGKHERHFTTLPDVPSFKEQGAASRIFTLTGFQCCAVPIGTPPEIVRKLSKLLVAGGKTEKVQQVMKTFGVDDTAMTFEETQRLYKEEAPIWLEAVTRLGIAPS